VFAELSAGAGVFVVLLCCAFDVVLRASVVGVGVGDGFVVAPLPAPEGLPCAALSFESGIFHSSLLAWIDQSVSPRSKLTMFYLRGFYQWFLISDENCPISERWRID
jgi:hypothetical protein